MTEILALSSYVASGHVGLSAIQPALNLLGHEVIALPTIILSNHPGHPHVSGFRIDVDRLSAMLKALEDNGRLDRVGTIMTGYLPSADHVAFARDLVEKVRMHRPEATYICDPVLGDDPKGVYIDLAAAEAIRDKLLPLADTALPNRFELQWLSGHRVESLDDAIAAARSLPAGEILATSIPIITEDAADGLATMLIGAETVKVCRTRQQAHVPNGTGDLLSALYTAERSLSRAVARLEHVITASIGKPELALIEAAKTWDTAIAKPGYRPDRNAHPGPWVAGADGCPGGWAVVFHPLDDPGAAHFEIVPDFQALLTHELAPETIAIDMPIGLAEHTTIGGRGPDVETRKVLGDRKSAVFSVPARAAVMCTDYREACATALQYSDPPRKVSKQAFNLFPKIREVDRAMTPALQERVYEVHPEASFWAMNGETPLDLPKKVKSRPHGPGMELRKNLLEAVGYDRHFLDTTHARTSLAGSDDFLDACAAAWSATRIARTAARRFPADPERDGKGLRMEIWC